MRSRFHPELVNGVFGDPTLFVDLFFERRAILFDLGDLGALSPKKLLRVRRVFVSHAHIDHFYGFDRLVRVLLGRPSRVQMFGPQGFVDQVAARLSGYTWNLADRYEVGLEIEAHEVVETESGPEVVCASRFALTNSFCREPIPLPNHSEPGTLVDEDGLRVRCAVLEHGTPCLAFALDEPEHIGFDKIRLAERGLALGGWLQDVRRALRRGVPPDTLMPVVRQAGSPGPEMVPLSVLDDCVRRSSGHGLAYVVDARPCLENHRKIVALVKGTSTLFIEAAFLNRDSGEAARRNHLTATDAGTLACAAGVTRMRIFHISPRYEENPNAVFEEARRAFEGEETGSEEPGGI